MFVRLATLSDLDAMTWVLVGASPLDPIYPYRFPDRDLYRDELFMTLCKQKCREYLATSTVVVCEMEEEDLAYDDADALSDLAGGATIRAGNTRRAKVVAFSAWDAPIRWLQPVGGMLSFSSSPCSLFLSHFRAMTYFVLDSSHHITFSIIHFHSMFTSPFHPIISYQHFLSHLNPALFPLQATAQLPNCRIIPSEPLILQYLTTLHLLEPLSPTEQNFPQVIGHKTRMQAFRTQCTTSKREFFDRPYSSRGVGHMFLKILLCHPDYQRRGAGCALTRWGIEQAARHGLDTTVFASPMGLALYKKLGFEEVGRFRVQVDGDDEYLEIPALVLKRKDVRSLVDREGGEWGTGKEVGSDGMGYSFCAAQRGLKRYG